MIARLQRALCLLTLAVAACAAAWWWPHGQAGWALLLLAPHAPVLAAEFAWMQSVNRLAPWPRVLRAWGEEVLHGWRVFGWRQPWRAQAVADRLAPGCAAPRGAPGRDGWVGAPEQRGANAPLRGVVFVHGFACNRGFWTPWLRQLAREGRPFVALTLANPGAPVESHAPAVAAAVAQVAAAAGGLAPLLVCHSMGGLVARAWYAGADEDAVHRIVTIGTPHAGTRLARLGRAACARQMRCGSAWLAQLAEREAARAVEAAGEGREAAPAGPRASAGTPLPKPAGRVGRYSRFVCWWSDCDNIVFPAQSATLPGADNRRVPHRPHVGLAFDARVVEGTLGLLSIA